MNDDNVPKRGVGPDRPPIDVWKLKLGSVKAPRCAVCGGPTRWGIQVRGVGLCDRHWTVSNRFRLRLGKQLPSGMQWPDQPSQASARPSHDNEWMLKASTAHLLVCVVCGDNCRWGKVTRGVRLCDRHWTVRNRLRALIGLPTISTRREGDAEESAQESHS